jgi:iturin family lipopeptide synthetase A
MQYISKDKLDFLWKTVDNNFKFGISIEPGDCIIDIGANIGIFACRCNELTHGKLDIHCFEPIKTLYDVCKNNVDFGKVINKGISSKEKTVTFTDYPNYTLLDNGDSVTIMRNSTDISEEFLEKQVKGTNYDCKYIPLSKYLDDKHINEIDLLKVGIDEYEILSGIKNKHWDIIKQIIIEVNIDGQVEKIKNILESKNYNINIEFDRDVYTLFCKKNQICTK